MPGKVKVKVVSGKNLPVMDRSNDTTDAYVEVKLGNVTFKTDVCRKSLNPIWNSEWFRFEMDDLELQDEPLQIRLMDHDTYSANDSIGKVYIDLNPLLTNPSKTKEPSGRTMSGWIPVYDTMHGIRGEVNLLVKVELFSDLNKFRQSSCGVKFFFSPSIPEGHQAIQLHGFVEELVVNDDPEYQWIDKIRTPRASNEARQTLFSKLSGEVQRRVGLKALELGGNAVLGYRQCFDLEGESGIVVRGIGTAATLTKSYDTQLSPLPPDKEFLPMDDEYYSQNPPKINSSNTQIQSNNNYNYPPPPKHFVSSSYRFTCSSMPQSILESFTNPQFTPPNNQNQNQTIIPIPSTSLSPIHHQKTLSPQTSCDSSIITFRRGSLLESDEEIPTTEVDEVDGDGIIFNYNSELRKSRKKDKYSTTGLIKRVNATKVPLQRMTSTDKLIQFFKKKNKNREDLQRGGPYRKPRIRRDILSFGRSKKKKCFDSHKLRRSTSESYSIGERSVESLPSIMGSDDITSDWSILPEPFLELRPITTLLVTNNEENENKIEDVFGYEEKSPIPIQNPPLSLCNLDASLLCNSGLDCMNDDANIPNNPINNNNNGILLFNSSNSIVCTEHRGSVVTTIGGVEHEDLLGVVHFVPTSSASSSSTTGQGPHSHSVNEPIPEEIIPSSTNQQQNKINSSTFYNDSKSNSNNTQSTKNVSPSKGGGSSSNGGTNSISTNGRRLSESDLSTPPKGILNSSIQAMLAGVNHGKGPNFSQSRRPPGSSDHFDMLEYPFITIYDLPPKFIQRIGGSVSARSVKLLERISNLDEPESRDSWWTELRMEIRSHARSICCNVILGYEEHTTICDDVCILSATGTAALVNSTVLSGDTGEGSSKFNPNTSEPKQQQQDKTTFRESNTLSRTVSFSGRENGGVRHGSGDEDSCNLCHIPYNEVGIPLPVRMARCGICKKGRVPDLMLATINIPSNISVIGKSCLIQAQVFRSKKDSKGESSAKEVSDSLPFLEYELHRRLINKLKVRGMNAIFCLNVQICLGENLIIATATGTALCLSGLPTPDVPKITAGNMKTDTQKVLQFQKVVQDAFDRNREFYKVTTQCLIPSSSSGGQKKNIGVDSSSSDDSDDDSPIINLATGNKDTYVLEVDDSEDIEIISELIDSSQPIGFEISNLENIIEYDDNNFIISKQQLFIHVWRIRIPNLTLRQLATHFDRILRSISFKFRSLRPCLLNKIKIRVELPEPDEMQLCVTGTALGLKEKLIRIIPIEGCLSSSNGSSTILPTSNSHSPSPLLVNTSKGSKVEDDVEMIFNMESDGSSVSGGIDTKNGSTHKNQPQITTITVSSPSSTSTPSPSKSLPPPNHPSPSSQIGDSSSTLNGNQNNYKSLQNSNQNKIPKSLSTGICSIPTLARSRSSINTNSKGRDIIEITTLSYIPGQRIEKYLGNLNFFFIRETTSIKEMGGATGFLHSFIMEVNAILRGHVAALGGNALVAYFMTELSLLCNPHKNQGQCLISVGGDAVLSLPVNPISQIQEE